MSKLTLSLVACALIGCASKPAQTLESPALAPGIAFAEAERYTQLVVVSRSGSDYRLLCVLELSERGLVLVAFTELGARLFTLEYGPDHMVIDRSPVLPSSFDAKLVLADLQLVYWPITILQSSMRDGWMVAESGQRGERRVLHHGEVVAEVRRGDDAIDILRPLLGYHMTITTLTK
jgi:hypothetical protein